MIRVVLVAYDYFRKRRILLLMTVLAVMIFSILSIARIDFKEDISLFLPEENNIEKGGRDSLFTNKVVVSFSLLDTTIEDPELICDALSFFCAELRADSLYSEHINDVEEQVSPERFISSTSWFLDNLPLLLSEEDYLFLDSILTGDYVYQCMEENRQVLMSPSGSFFRDYITSDPLRFAGPIIHRMQTWQRDSGFELYGDFVFLKGGKEGLVTVQSRHSVSDVVGNGLMFGLIQRAADATCERFGHILTYHWFGPADIAITNTERLKDDCVISILVALLIIVVVLVRKVKSARGIALMIFSLLFGWVFALGILGVIKHDVSLISVGITSIIIGVALNYPLHLILHYRSNGNVRTTLKDIVPPLTIGNVTTMAAFLSLLFIKSPAMQDMGLFSALLLFGVILFVLFVLPHGLPCLSVSVNSDLKQPIPCGQGTDEKYLRKKFPLLSGLMLAITVIFLIFSFSVSFETDMSRINYLTDEQKSDISKYLDEFAFFTELIPDASEQESRLESWNLLLEDKHDILDSVSIIGEDIGFRKTAFQPFYQIMGKEYSVIDNFTDSDILDRLVDNLADDFDRVLFFCGIVVFVFLCLTLGRLELGIIAFLPLAIGWIWILGIMGLLNINFNIVNIVLVTMIFGQGDDYTIFITEGLMHEYAYGKKMVDSYKKSVLLSAVIMFVGIGSLIIAKHPALRSLAEVTVVGMGIVVLMSFYVPQFFFKWLVGVNGKWRETPVTLLNLCGSIFSITVLSVTCFLAGLVGFVLFDVGLYRNLKRGKEWYHRLIYRIMIFFQRGIPRIKFEISGSENLKYLEKEPVMLICNHQSHLDLLAILAIYPKMIVLTKDWVRQSSIIGRVVRYADFYSVDGNISEILQKLSVWVRQGYSIMVFPEGTRSHDCSIGRFHSGAFYLAEQLGLKIMPVIVHGSGHVLPKDDFMLRRGRIDVKIYEPMSLVSDTALGNARWFRRFYQSEYLRISAEIEDAFYFKDKVLLSYAFKGALVAAQVRKEYEMLCKTGLLDGLTDCTDTDGVVEHIDSGYGLYSLFYALVHKDVLVRVRMDDEEKAMLMHNNRIRPKNLEVWRSM